TEILLSAPLPPVLRMTLLLAGLSFGGISTAAQTAGMIRGSGLRLSLYLKGKLLQAGLAAAFTLLFFAVVYIIRVKGCIIQLLRSLLGRIRGSGLLLRRQLASVFIHDIVAALQRTDEAAVALAYIRQGTAHDLGKVGQHIVRIGNGAHADIVGVLLG